jgi:hypothetical protein
MKIAAADFSGRFEEVRAGSRSDGWEISKCQDQPAGIATRSLKGVTIRRIEIFLW